MRLPGIQQSGAAVAAAAVVVGLVTGMTRLAGLAFHHEGPFTTVTGATGLHDSPTPSSPQVLLFLTDSLVHLRTGEPGMTLEARAAYVKGTLNALVPRFAGSGRAPRVVVQPAGPAPGSERLVVRESEDAGWYPLLTVTRQDVSLERAAGAPDTDAGTLARKWSLALQAALDHVAESPVWAAGQ